ncbi:MAG: 2-oxoglutarate dehydrogenase complex dihydrolipoyllysine-residue succinyltransferase [Rhodospirillales bacterium]|nr:2-oxoglutarate dehydrogenase complex dihydrolipoyllysine-residue succinyltransferase [Rhodospirillales bacterium]MDE0380844.1 2-oxoglutarate dehydrogenase complex dihydrolipoyllysine-residue succinyltransferase [Rhodospirillales bacterium]
MTVDITVPALGESVTEATVMRWLKAPGDAVATDEILVELETDKIAVEVTAERAGTLAEIVAAEGADVEVGALLGKLETGVEAATVAAAPQPEPQRRGIRLNVPPQMSPAVRRLVEEQGIDPEGIKGTGKGGRLLKSDVLAAVVARASAAAKPEPDAGAEPASAAAPQPEAPPEPAPATPEPAAASSLVEQRREERVPMSRLRRRAAERLKLAQDTAAMLTTFNEVDMTALTALRAAHGEAFEQKHGVRLGFMSFFVKASVAALVEYPAVNAEIDGDDIVYKHYHDIGVAVSAPQGLVVPVLRDAGSRSFAEIEQGIRAAALKARDGKLALDDLLGGTFTISNGGVFGSLMSTPIINPPQSAILGMHKVQERPVAVAGAVEIRPMMYLALSYDHRLIDGREAVSFLVRIKDCIEDPQRMLLDL